MEDTENKVPQEIITAQETTATPLGAAPPVEVTAAPGTEVKTQTAPVPTPGPAPAKPAAISTQIMTNHDSGTNTALIGMQRTGCDPLFFNAGGGLLSIFGMLPTMLAEAGMKWKVTPKNPESKLPAEPAPAPAARTPTTRLAATATKPGKPEASKPGAMQSMM